MVRTTGAVKLALLAAAWGLSVGATTKPPAIEVTRVAPPKEKFGDWTVTFLSNGNAIASTGNSAGAVFGTICSKSGCTAFANPNIECDDGDKYPALVNTPDLAFNATLVCEKVGKDLFYNLPMEGGITEAMSVGGVIGFAFPMQSGEFKVARFSLTGAARASARALQHARSSGAPSKTPTRDSYSL